MPRQGRRTVRLGGSQQRGRGPSVGVVAAFCVVLWSLFNSLRYSGQQEQKTNSSTTCVVRGLSWGCEEMVAKVALDDDEKRYEAKREGCAPNTRTQATAAPNKTLGQGRACMQSSGFIATSAGS